MANIRSISTSQLQIGLTFSAFKLQRWTNTCTSTRCECYTGKDVLLSSGGSTLELQEHEEPRSLFIMAKKRRNLA